MLSTLLRPTGGRALVNGFDVVCRRGAVRRSIGLVFQQPTLDEALSAEQNLRFSRVRVRHSGHPRDQQMRELLSLVPMRAVSLARGMALLLGREAQEDGLEAGGVPRGEQLLRIGAGAAAASQLLLDDELEIEPPVRRADPSPAYPLPQSPRRCREPSDHVLSLRW
jgi:ABC-type branched-subunit amino acid transport system ATPase component